MAVSPKIIYLESDEEVTSVVDKMRKTEFNKVVLVIPKEASLLQSVINLKLLKRQAQNLDKQLAIVTNDKTGRSLAQKVGLLASAKLEEVVNEAEFVPVPLEDLEEEKEPVRVASESESPLKETDEIVYKSKPQKAQRKEEDEEELLVVKEEPELAEIEEKEEETFAKKQIEEPEPGNLMPKLPKKKFLIISGILAFVLLAAGFIYIPRARATVLVKAERKPVSIDFRSEKEAKIDTAAAVIPTQLVESTKESSKKFQATGKKNVGNKASGTLRIANLSGSDINWVTGTRFVPTSNTGLIYKSASPVFAPDGQITSIVVQAADPGDQYNGFGSNQTFTLAAASLGSNVTITCKDGMTGGSNREITYITQSDVDTAKDNLSKEAFDTAKSDFEKKTEGIKIVDQTKKEKISSSNVNPSVNTESSDFTLTVNVSVKALGYRTEDIGQLVKAEVERELGFAKKIIDDGAKDASVNVDSSDLDKGTLSGTIKTDAYVSSKIDEEQIKTDLTGLSSEKADKYLKGIEGVEETRLEFFPSFLKIFPRLRNHIVIEIEVAEKETN
jgi:hypothetical protein